MTLFLIQSIGGGLIGGLVVVAVQLAFCWFKHKKL